MTQKKSLAERSAHSVWHPCTQMASLQEVPVIPIVSAEGPWLYTEDGRQLFDGISSWWTCLLGHRNPGIVARIEAQLSCLDHTMLAGLTHAPAVELAEALVQRTGNALSHVSFASDGASAIELALKQSAHAWAHQGEPQKTDFICLAGSYHGETLGALGITDLELFQSAYSPLIRRAIAVPAPDSREARPDGSMEDAVSQALTRLEDVLKVTHKHVAALITEPLLQAAKGMVMYPPSYLRGVRTLADRYEVHWIADEIATGCGRTGSFFAVEQADVWPDLMALSKGLSGGVLPLSVTLSRDAIFQSFWSSDLRRAFMHSHSFSGNPLACAAALGMLAQLTPELLVANAKQSDQLHETLASLRDVEGVTGLRRLGMVFAFEHPEARRVADEALRRGLWIRPLGNTVYLMPPFLVEEDTWDWLGASLVEAVKAI